MSIIFNKEIEWDVASLCFIIFLNWEGWSSCHIQANEHDISDYLRNSNHHHLTEEIFLFKVEPPLFNI